MCSLILFGRKCEGRRLSMVTCYDYTFARLLSRSAVDAILVGDSAAMVMHGHTSTLYATVDMMRLHTEAVVRGAARTSSWSRTCRFSRFGKVWPRRWIPPRA